MGSYHTAFIIEFSRVLKPTIAASSGLGVLFKVSDVYAVETLLGGRTSCFVAAHWDQTSPAISRSRLYPQGRDEGIVVIGTMLFLYHWQKCLSCAQDQLAVRFQPLL